MRCGSVEAQERIDMACILWPKDDKLARRPTIWTKQMLGPHDGPASARRTLCYIPLSDVTLRFKMAAVICM